MLEYSIREATINDIESIYELELESFKNPWSIENYQYEFNIHFSCMIVAERKQNIIGFAVLWLVNDEIHLQKIAVAHFFRRQGIARALIDFIIGKFGNTGARIILLEVRGKNAGARSFYEKLGFRENGIRRDYYPDDNAILIEKLI